MLATILITDPQTGQVVTLRVGDVDAAGRLTDHALFEAIRRGGYTYSIRRDYGLMHRQFNDARGGFGWGGGRGPHGRR